MESLQFILLHMYVPSFLLHALLMFLFGQNNNTVTLPIFCKPNLSFTCLLGKGTIVQVWLTILHDWASLTAHYCLHQYFSPEEAHIICSYQNHASYICIIFKYFEWKVVLICKLLDCNHMQNMLTLCNYHCKLKSESQCYEAILLTLEPPCPSTLLYKHICVSLLCANIFIITECKVCYCVHIMMCRNARLKFILPKTLSDKAAGYRREIWYITVPKQLSASGGRD